MCIFIVHIYYGSRKSSRYWLWWLLWPCNGLSLLIYLNDYITKNDICLFIVQIYYCSHKSSGYWLDLVVFCRLNPNRIVVVYYEHEIHLKTRVSIHILGCMCLGNVQVHSGDKLESFILNASLHRINHYVPLTFMGAYWLVSWIMDIISLVRWTPSIVVEEIFFSLINFSIDLAILNDLRIICVNLAKMHIYIISRIYIVSIWISM
jgi:hypothetical protein